MNTKIHKKTTFFGKTSTFAFESRKKYMALKIFEFREQNMIDTFLMTLTHCEKTGSRGTLFIPPGNLDYCCSIVRFTFF